MPRRANRERSGSDKRAGPEGLKFIEPSLATLRSQAPNGSGWIHEVKFDGYRAQAHLLTGHALIYTRRGYDWTQRFEDVANALSRIKVREAILDGEIVVLNERGLSDFRLLQEDLARGRSERLVFYAFDLLQLNGRSLMKAPLLERKQALSRVLRQPPQNVRYTEHFALDGEQVFKQACDMHFEGIISKRADAPYRSGRTDSWIKTKCVKRQHYPIVAFVEKLGAKPRRIASLYLGQWVEGRLLYAGKAQSGFTQRALYDLRERLDPYIRAASPLAVAVKKPKATWVEPVVEAEVQFIGTTSDGLLREPVYKGVRDDLATPERPKARTRSDRSSVPRENILQRLPDVVVPTKEMLRAYWERVGQRALIYLANRPLKLVRHVRGTTFYHKGSLPPIPATVHQVRVRKREGGEGVRVWVDDVAGLVGLLELDVIEVHPWNSKVSDIERADQMVFDLDPGEGVEWSAVLETADRLRTMLTSEGFASWPKLTGGKGLHVMVPLEEPLMHDAAHDLSRRLAQRIARMEPKLYTLSASIAGRRGRMFIDYLRNGRGTTAVGTFSPRARAGFPIAAPITWRRLQAGARSTSYDLDHLPRGGAR